MRFSLRLIKVILVGALVMVGTLPAFAKGQSESSSAKVTVNWWFHLQLSGVEGQILTQYGKEFEAKYPNVNVAYRSIPTGQYLQQLPTSIASGNAPDLFAMSYRNIFPYIDNHSLAPVDQTALKAMGVDSMQAFLAKWAPHSLDAYKINNEYYGLPFQFNIYAYILNTDQFRQAGLDPSTDYPKTWADVYSVAKKLVVKKDGRIVRQAVSFPFIHDPAWYLLYLEPVMRSLGSSVMSQDGTKCLVNSAAGVEAMKIIKQRFTDNVASTAIAASLDYYNTGFPTGQFSMTIGGQWGPPRWYKNFTSKTHEGEFLAVPYPTAKPGENPPISTTSWAWVVYAKSKVKPQAWALADYATSMPSRQLKATGDIIPRTGWSDTPGAKTLPQAKFWEKMIQYSQPLAAYKYYAQIADPLKRAMQKILLSNADIKTTLDQTAAEIDQAIKQAG